MPDLDTQVRRYVEAVVDQVRPVTADEARRRAARRRIVSRPRLLVLAAAVVGVVTVAGVLIAVDASQEDDTRVTTDDTTAMTDAPSKLPRSLGGQRDWLVAYYNGDHNPSEDEIKSRFTRSFLAEVHPSELRMTAATLSELGARWTVLEDVDRRDDTLATQLVADNGDQAQLTLTVTAGGRIKDTMIVRALPCDAIDPGAAALAPPLAARLGWVLDLLNDYRDVADDEIIDSFAPSFLDEITPDQVRAWSAPNPPLAPFKLRHFAGEPKQDSLVARIGGSNGREGELRISIEPDEPFRITSLSSLVRRPCRLPE